ncbi:hypothetical protein [Pendulispora albinea]|uniref:Methyltransferase domain-containing protein n=1 Tax=Pendulispora albinea TaxID=2741071 RepID=A0ABZ2M4C4_9BACT
MNRIHAPEIEDYDWCPAVLRDTLTEVLRTSCEVFRVFDSAAKVVAEVLDETGATRVVDLCSGSGGPAVVLLDALERLDGRRIDAVLTDKYPNAAAFARAEAEGRGRIVARRDPIDATATLPEDLTGVRTLFNALHHFRPSMARAILGAAARDRQPIACFEMVERSLQGVAIVGTTPFMVAASVPFLKPRTWKRLALTYALPVLPAMIAWDGFASCLRAYSPAELRQLVDGLGDENYQFRVFTRRAPWNPVRVTGVVGVPVMRARDRVQAMGAVPAI